MQQLFKVGIASFPMGLGVLYYMTRENKIDLNLNFYNSLYSTISKYNLVWAVELTKFCLKNDLLWKSNQSIDQVSQYSLLGQPIHNPVGIAGGYDIEGDCIVGLQNLGFGFIEIGSTTPQSQITKNLDDKALDPLQYQIENSTFGILKCKANIISLREQGKIKVPIGVNIMPSEETITYTPYLMQMDFENSFREIFPYADYVVLNLIGSQSINPLYENNTVRDQEFMQNLIPRLIQIKKDEIFFYTKLFKELNETEMNPESIGNVSQQFSVPPISLEDLSKTKLLVKVSSKIDSILLQQLLDTQIDGLIFEKQALEDEREYLSKLTLISQKKPIISVGDVKNHQQILDRLSAGAVGVQTLSFFLQNGPGHVQSLIHG